MAYNDTAELRTQLQAEVGDTNPTGETSARYLQRLDTAHKTIVGGGGELNLDDSEKPIRRPYLFSWAKSENPLTLVLEPKQVSTGTVTIDVATVTIGIASGTKDLTGWFINFADHATVYRILSHSGTTITLNSTYVGDTGVGIACDIYKLIYTITPPTGEILLIADSFRTFYQKEPLSITDEAELLNQFPLKDSREANPMLSAIVKQTPSSIVVRISSYPKTRQMLQLMWVPKPADLNPGSVNPIIPNAEKNRVLVHLAAFYELRKRDDDRANSHLKSARMLFDALTIEDQQFVNGNDTMYGYISPFPGGFPVGNFFTDHDVDNIP